MNCGPSDQLPGFLDLNWDQSAPPNSFPPTSNVGEYFTQPLYMSALLNSPPKLQLSMMDHRRQQQDSGNSTLSGGDLSTFSTDPGFIERAAKFSNFVGCRNYGRLTGQFELLDAGKLSSCNSLRMNGLQLGSVEMGNAGDDSSASNPFSASESNARKRKAVPKGKGKDSPKAVVEAEDTNAKRGRLLDDSKSQKYEIESKVEQKCGVCSSTVDDEKEMGKENNVKPPEPPKQDYIHVRARRGQATDSHSLAERVRREKISERMKLLQGLVPGCNKVNGKALMLDEIINYVQSLQQQVEFLSLKLSSVNPWTDFDVENLIQKDIPQGSDPLLNSVSAAAFSYAHQSPQCVMRNGLETQCSMNPLESVVHRTISMQLQPENGLLDPNSSQFGTFWEDDLHNVVQMGFTQSQEMTFNGFRENFWDSKERQRERETCIKIELGVS